MKRWSGRGGFSRRSVLVGAGVLLAACGKIGAAKAADILRVSITGKGESDTQLLFKTAGIEPSGYTIDYVRFESGHLVLEAMNGHSLDYGGVSEIPPIFALGTSNPSFRQIAVAHGDVNNQVVLVPKGSRIDDLAGLKGKRVGYVRATTSQYFLIRMLQSVGLSWSDITPVAMTVSDGASAFSSGALDAWAIYGFPIQRAIATEGARILKTALGILSGNYLVAAHVDALADPAKSALIGEYLAQTRQAYAWAAAHRDEWAGVIARDIGVPLAYVQDEFHRRSDVFSLRPVDDAAIASQQAVANVFADQNLIPGRVDVRPLWDNRFNSIIEGKS